MRYKIFYTEKFTQGILGTVIFISFTHALTLGDLNNDGITDVLDIVRTVNIILEIPPDPTEYEHWAGDMNGDDEINIVDVNIMVEVVLGIKQWYSLGLEDKIILELRLYPPYLYACAGPDGLWRLNVETGEPEWEYLGMSLEDMGSTEGSGVKDMVVNYDDSQMMLVIFRGDNANPIYKTVDSGETWFGLEDDGTPHLFMQTQTRIYTGDNGLSYSEDFGDTWEYISAVGFEIYSLSYHPLGENIIWVGGIDAWGMSGLK